MDKKKVDSGNKSKKSTKKDNNSKFSLIKTLRNKAYKLILDKHNSDKDTLYRKTANDIVYNEKSHIVAVFKDYLIYDDTSEFLKRTYNINETKFRLPKYLEYYELNSKIFPNYINLPESKYLYRNIKRKQRMIDSIQKHENDKKRKKENEETMILNSQIIDYIINQTSICDSQTNINLNNSLKKPDVKNALNKKVIAPASKQSKGKNKQENVKDKNANKNKNANFNNNNYNLIADNYNNDNKNVISENKKNNNFASSENLQIAKKEENKNLINNANNNNLDIFSKFEKQNYFKHNFNENGSLKAKNKIGKIEEKSFVSVEFLIKAIDQAEKIVSKNQQSHRDPTKLQNNLNEESKEDKQNSQKLSQLGVMSNKFFKEKQENSFSKNKNLQTSKCNYDNQIEINNNNINSESKLNSNLNLQKRFIEKNSKKSFSKPKQNQNQNQIENASTFNTAEVINSNLSAKDKKYLTRNEIILNNLLSKNNLNKELKTGLSDRTNKKDFEKRNEINLENYYNKKNYCNKFDGNLNNKNYERENSIANQRRKLEKELNLCDVENNEQEKDLNLDIFKIKDTNNQLDFYFKDYNNNHINDNNTKLNGNFETKNKVNAESYEFLQRSLSRNLLNFNCISSINNPSTEKNGLLSHNSKIRDNSGKIAALPLNSEANRILLSNSQPTPAAEKTRIYSTTKKMSSKLLEKESQLLINKLNNHFNFNNKNNENFNADYNTNILSSRENFKVLFNKTNFDFAIKGKINSYRQSQNLSTANAKKEIVVLKKQSSKNINNYKINNNEANENHNFPELQSKQNLISTGNNNNQTQKVNFFSNSRADITTNDNKNYNINNKNCNYDKPNFKNNEIDINTNNIKKSESKIINYCINESAYKQKINNNPIEYAGNLANANLSNTQKQRKLILQSGNLISKEEIKITSYRSKETNSNNFKTNINNNNFNKSNNTNFINTAREFSRQAKSGFSFLNSENYSVINNNNINNNNNNAKNTINALKSIFSPINKSTKFIANLSPKQSFPVRADAQYNLENKINKNASNAINNEKDKEAYNISSLINFNNKNILSMNNSNTNLNCNNNNNVNNNLNTNKNNTNRHNNNKNDNFLTGQNYNSKILSNGKNNVKITNSIGNAQVLGSDRNEKNGNHFLYNIIGNEVKPHEAEFKILSARLSRKAEVARSSMSHLQNPDIKSIETFEKYFLKEKISKLNSNNTKLDNNNIGVNSQFNLQNSNCKGNLMFNSSNNSIKLNFSHKNKSRIKSNFDTNGYSAPKIQAAVDFGSINNENLVNNEGTDTNIKNKNYNLDDKNNRKNKDGKLKEDNNDLKNSSKNLINNANMGNAGKIKGIFIKNFNQILQNNLSGAKACYSG